ncbi:MAG TPA: hemin uptake protein HemP [Hyphomicrobium sp.]|nr:hemin uptake protein HemP [Hyphomicrobium sp.]
MEALPDHTICSADDSAHAIESFAMTPRESDVPDAVGDANAQSTGDRKSAERGSNVVPRISVGALMNGGREAILDHNDQVYRLRITASGKLILTK